MKQHLSIFILLLCAFSAGSQTPITVVATTTTAAAASKSYVDGEDNYNWGVSPNNMAEILSSFTANAVQYLPATDFPGTVKLRRVDNTANTGDVTLVWVASVSSGTTYNMFPEYQNDLEAFLNNLIYNKGADNLFDNTAPNSNNVERYDWLLPQGYSTTTPSQAGIPVFDRGNSGSHDAFCIAAITSLDGSGNPLTYGNIVRVASTDYGDPGPAVTYTVLKGTFPGDLFVTNPVVTGASQGRGGVFISLQDLGITAGTVIYGYSLFSPDLPLSATSADLVDYTNTTFFPTNTGSSGGIELLAISGLAGTATVLPTHFTTFDAVETDDIINLKWTVENEASSSRYEVERSVDGINFEKINEINAAGNKNYVLPDNVTNIAATQLYYRIKEYDLNGSYFYSKTVAIKRNKNGSILIYPNPVIKALYVNIKSVVNDRGVVSITNSTGAEVIRQPIQLVNGNNSITIQKVTNLPHGIYQLSIKLNSGKNILKQFSKQ
jgi:hypothetical protein